MHSQCNAGLMTSAPEAYFQDKMLFRGFPYGGFLKWWYPTTMAFPTTNDHFRMFWGYHHLRKHPYQCMKCRQGAVDVVVFVVEVVVVEVVVERCSVKITVAVSTSICVTTSVIVVGFLEPSASSSTEVFVVVVDVAAAVVGAAVVAAADVVGATVSAAVVAAVVAATVVSAASGSSLLASDLKTKISNQTGKS